MVKKRFRVLVCGSSIFMNALQASLNQQNRLEVVCINRYLPEFIPRLLKEDPDLVILMEADLNFTVFQGLIQNQIRVCVINSPTGEATLFSQDQVAFDDIDGLIGLIQAPYWEKSE
jgi:hypothetical protein